MARRAETVPPPVGHIAHMITTILFFFLLFGIIAIMHNPPYGFGGENISPFGMKPSRIKTREAGEGKCFEEFCGGECKYRFLCLRKHAAQKKGTCMEHELTSNRLW
jgi:hypothetical protein